MRTRQSEPGFVGSRPQQRALRLSPLRRCREQAHGAMGSKAETTAAETRCESEPPMSAPCVDQIVIARTQRSAARVIVARSRRGPASLEPASLEIVKWHADQRVVSAQSMPICEWGGASGTRGRAASAGAIETVVSMRQAHTHQSARERCRARTSGVVATLATDPVAAELCARAMDRDRRGLLVANAGRKVACV